MVREVIDVNYGGNKVGAVSFNTETGFGEFEYYPEFIALNVELSPIKMPLDRKMILELAGRIKRIVTVEENVLSGGFGSGVLEVIQEAGLCDVAVHTLGIPDEFVEHGSQAVLRSRYGLDASGIVQEVQSLVKDPMINTSRVGKGGRAAEKE